MTKQEIRKQMREKIASMQQQERDDASRRVCMQIVDNREWQSAKIVLLYAALPDEVSLSFLCVDSDRFGKRVLLPVVKGDSLELRYYDSVHALAENHYGILEPDDSCSVLSDYSQIDLAIIPGRAFTPGGQRLGRGKGYYDRLLPSLHCPKWGVAFACQLVDELPLEPWDTSLDKVFSNK